MRARWVLVAAALWATPGLAGPEKAEDIARRALDSNLLSTRNARAEVELEVSRDGKVVRKRHIVTKIRSGAGETRSYVEFLAPADVAGTKFLSVDKKGEESQQLMFLPAFKKVKRVVGAQRNRSFMGTDFSYADLEGRDVEDATWTRLPDGEVGGQAVYVLEGIPKKGGDEQYGRTVLYVHTKHMVPMRIDFFSASDPKALEKRFSVKRLEKKQDRWVATDSVMATEKKGTSTRLRLVQVDFAASIADEDLSRAALER
ncbi:MAG: outer membrane lipoprotein-sorting protein [Myxococcales bacterium]|nr:outer membrane lipoprotein-sorting protein [Myxococcales bacterium]